MIVAQAFLHGLSIAQMAIYAVVFAAVCALVYVAVTAMGIPVPEWVKHALWIVVIAFVIILAIRFVASL